jgi:hypothetical protein
MTTFPELHVERVPRSYQVPFHVLDDKGRLVALIQGDQLKPKELSIGEAEAYARLFAASSKLVAAAIAVLKGPASTVKRGHSPWPAKCTNLY